MKNHLQSLITASAIVAGLAIPSMGQTELTDAVRVPPVPSDIQVPAGNTAYLKLSAAGTQNYICRPSQSGTAWSLFGPQATLFFNYKLLNRDIQQQLATHFLSANPAENGMARPIWQSSLDTSRVWGKAVASSTDSTYVAPGSIAWLLVEVVGSQRGPSGGSMFSPTTYIQRLNTSAGTAPTAGCSQPSDAGNSVLVPYAADYYFYKASRSR